MSLEFEHSAGMLISFDTTQAELRRPFYLCRAEMHKHGPNDWKAVYGAVEGYGKTPQIAAIAFDLVWLNGSIEKAHLMNTQQWSCLECGSKMGQVHAPECSIKHIPMMRT